MRRLVLPVLLLACPAAAQAPSPGQVFGSIVMMLAVVDECGIAVRAEMKEALAVEALRLQLKLRIPDHEVVRFQAETAQSIKGGECSQARARFDTEAAAVLNEARQAAGRDGT